MQLRETQQQQQNIESPGSLDLIGTTSGSASISSLNGTKERTRDLALCAVILDEWLKELAAISQEQSIVMLADDI